MLVPLTASLYVPGTLDDADKVLVDVGTGYFIEVRVNVPFCLFVFCLFSFHNHFINTSRDLCGMT